MYNGCNSDVIDNKDDLYKGNKASTILIRHKYELMLFTVLNLRAATSLVSLCENAKKSLSPRSLGYFFFFLGGGSWYSSLTRSLNYLNINHGYYFGCRISLAKL